jgi:hypothetical protein
MELDGLAACGIISGASLIRKRALLQQITHVYDKIVMFSTSWVAIPPIYFSWYRFMTRANLNVFHLHVLLRQFGIDRVIFV